MSLVIDYPGCQRLLARSYSLILHASYVSYIFAARQASGQERDSFRLYENIHNLDVLLGLDPLRILDLSSTAIGRLE